jgi:hypothetical protein
MDADGQGSVSFLIQGSSKLIHLTAGRVNGLWNFVGLVPPTFFLELIPTQGGDDILSPMIACTGILAFRSGTTIR